MGAALKKNHDWSALSHLRWAAWGVIDIEKLERMQRRNYINSVREELKLHGAMLYAGGHITKTHYRATIPIDDNKSKTWADNGPHAFTEVCRKVLLHIEPTAHPE